MCNGAPDIDMEYYTSRLKERRTMRIDMELDGYLNIAGGQFCDEAGCVDEYYIQFEEVNLELDSNSLKKLAVDAINHLMDHGHNFEFVFTDMGQKEIK